MTDKHEEINGDICAIRCAVNGLYDNKENSTSDQKAEIREIFLKLRDLILFNMSAGI